jgi:hypothetical protein
MIVPTTDRRRAGPRDLRHPAVHGHQRHGRSLRRPAEDAGSGRVPEPALTPAHPPTDRARAPGPKQRRTAWGSSTRSGACVTLVGGLLLDASAHAWSLADTCEARKLKTSGEYSACQLRAESRAVEIGATPDSETVEDVSVRFATFTYTTPDGVTHENTRERRTFVVVKRSGRWLVMQDQATIVVGQ